jgi:hypothetical protein
MSEEAVSCVQTAAGPIAPPGRQESSTEQPMETRKESTMALARVGHEAPDFEASAYVDGGFKNIKLSDYRGKWVILCFYPGDFTFV